MLQRFLKVFHIAIFFIGELKEGDTVIILNLVKIIGFFGLIIGIELVAVAIYMVSVLYLRNTAVAGVIGNMSSLSIIFGLIGYSLNKEMK
jgi:hypothetical protein